jgi:CRP/FNR family transcriptional regulator, cyclic AMP receptor protein
MSDAALQKTEEETRSLAGIALLRRLTPEERADLEGRCTFRKFSAGDIILDRFSASVGVFFLVAGTARVVHFVADHEEITIATIAPGDTIGDISAIDGLGRSATVMADSDCLAAELPRPEFHALLGRCGEVALDLLRRWAGTIRQLSDKVSFLSTGTPDQRVYSELVRLARPEKQGSERWLIRELPSHQDLARWAQTSREIVAGAVADLVRRGVAERRTRTLYISDYAMLRSLTLGTAATPADPQRGGTA